MIDLDNFCFGFSLKLSRVYYPWPMRVPILSLLFYKWRYMVIHGITWQYMDIPGNAWFIYMLIRKEGRKEGRKESFSDERTTDVPLYLYINM